MSGETETWSETVRALRERGYLGRRAGAGGGWTAPLRPLAWTAAGLGVAVIALALVGSAPATAATWLAVTVLTAPIALLGGGAAVAVVIWAAARAHRAGLQVGRSAAAAAVAGGAITAGVWLAAAARPPAVLGSRGLVAGVLVVVGVALVMRGVARTIASRLLGRSPSAGGVPPRLWAVSALTLLGLAVAGVAAWPGGRAGPGGEAVGALAVRPASRPMAILALDGARREEVLLLAERGGALAGIANWAWATVAVGHGADPLPVRWITVATGVPPSRHGVTTLRQLHVVRPALDLLLSPALHRTLAAVWQPAGVVSERTVPAAYRSAPTVWEMVARSGAPVLVAGWWGSFPPRRVRGVVGSERWLFTGEVSRDTVFPAVASGLPAAPAGGSPEAIDLRAVAALMGVRPDSSPLVMGYLPGWWLEASAGQLAPLLAARRLRVHLDALGTAAEELLAAGYPLWIVGMVPGGPAWVISSAGRAGRGPGLRPQDLVETWLDAVGLPPALGLGGEVRRDLSGRTPGALPGAQAYGPPPPMASAAPPEEGTAQLELLRNLGYLQ